MEELELLNNLKKRDGKAYRILVEQYQKFILNICFRFTNNKEISEDLTQDIFIEIFRSIQMFKGNAKFRTWIYRIVITKCLDHLKGAKRKKRFAMFQSIFGDHEMVESLPASDTHNPAKQLEDQERIKILQLALDELPTNQRIAFTLSKYDEMSYQEIASVLDSSIPSVESLIHRAKLNLRKKLYSYYQKHL
jgi:RNA polymerase sigma-70 factor (ECF subfamily)